MIRVKRQGLAYALLATLALMAAPVKAGEPHKSHAEMVLSAIDAEIIPRIEKLDVAATALEKALTARCAAPAAEQSAPALTEALAVTAEAWAGVDYLRFGPMMQNNRNERFFYWPDLRGIMSRQVSAILAKRDAALLVPGALAAQSAAVQGLSALEIVLFEKPSNPANTDPEAQHYRCAFAAAIGTNLSSIARDLKDGWQGPTGFRMQMIATGSDNPLYKDASETGRDIVKAIATGLDLASNRFVAAELDAAAKAPPKPARLPFARAELETRFLAASISSIAALFNATGLAAYVPPDKSWMTSFIPTRFKQIEDDLAKHAATRAAPPADEARLAVIRKLKFDLGAIRLVVVKELAPAADLTLGFNELDGD